MEEKSETLALCLFELQNCLLSLDAISEVINNCRILSSYGQVTHLILESEIPQEYERGGGGGGVHRVKTRDGRKLTASSSQ